MTSQPYMQGLDPNALEAAAPELDARLRSLATTLEAYGLDYMQAHHVIEKVRALASIPQQTAEPVAWRFKSDDPNYDDAYVYCATEEMALLRCPKNSGVEPLYTHPASPSVGGTVKGVDPKLVKYVEMLRHECAYKGPCADNGDGCTCDYEELHARHIRALASSERSGREAAEAALQSLHGAWIQFINCWADPFDDPKAEAEEERRNVKALGAAFDECWELGLFGDAIRNLAGTKTNG